MPEPHDATAPPSAAPDAGGDPSSDGSAGTRREAGGGRKAQGDIHVGSMAGDVKRVPGSGTENGDKAIADFMRDMLERVRRSIRERTRRQG